MNTILHLTYSSIKMFVRNKQALFFTLISPLIIMGIFGLLAFDRVPQVDLGVAVTAPPNAGTEAFLEQLKSVPAFNVQVGTETVEREAIKEGERAAVLVIPGNFFPENGKPTGEGMIILINSSQPQQSSTAVSIVNQILDKTTLAATGAPPLFNVRTEDVSSRNFKYIDFLVPGIVALSIMQMSVFSVAFIFADYKEKGVLKRLLATPMKPYEFVTANVITRLIVSVIQAAFLIGVGVLVFKAQVIGSYFLLIPIVVLGAIMFLGMGFTISGFANTVETVPAIANLIVFPMLFLGGTFFPIDTMPTWLQHVANYLPLTYLSTAMREVMLNGATFSEIQSNIWWMLAWAVALVAAANFSFSMEEKRQ